MLLGQRGRCRALLREVGDPVDAPGGRADGDHYREGSVSLEEEEDELLRAAEVLGIDLSGVRAGGDGAADEQEEQVVAEGDGGSTDGAKGNGAKGKKKKAEAGKEKS